MPAIACDIRRFACRLTGCSAVVASFFCLAITGWRGAFFGVCHIYGLDLRPVNIFPGSLTCMALTSEQALFISRITLPTLKNEHQITMRMIEAIPPDRAD